MEFLQSQEEVDKDNIFLVGQSNGGSVALMAASGVDKSRFPSEPKFRAVVAYYPWCGVLSTQIVSPLLVFGAGRDDWVPPKRCVDMKPKVRGANYNVVVYNDAHHSFDLPIPVQNYVGNTVVGNKSATKDSQQKLLSWFQEHMR